MAGLSPFYNPMEQLSPWLQMGGGENNMMPKPFYETPAAPTRPTPDNPAVVQAPQPKASPYTVQPTTEPIGVMPQEMTPSQPGLMDNAANMRLYQQAYENFKLPDNSRMLKELSLGEKSYAESQMARQSEIDKLKEGLANYTKQDRGTDFTPLAALSDAWFGGNLSAAAAKMAPETEAQKSQKMFDMQKNISALQGEMPKEELDALKIKLSQMGYMDERALKSEVAKLNAAAKMATAGQTAGYQQKRLGIQEKRLDTSIEKEARASVNNDPSLKQFMPRLEGAAKVGELIQAAREGKVIKNQALLGQLNSEIARLETGSQAPGLHASEKTELMDAAAQLGSIRDRVTGNPSDAVRPEVLNAAGMLVDELTLSYMRGIDSRMNLLKSGMTPEQQVIVDAKHDSLKSTYAPRFGHWSGESVAPKVGDIVEGHEFLGGDPSNENSWRSK